MTAVYVGIDLGTTNSAISTYNGDRLRILKSPEQNDVTPSAILFGPRGTKYIGKRAYDNAPREPDSAAVLFKRLMGTGTPISIASAGLTLTPEQCSAEVLRVLFGYLPEDVRTVVPGTIITVPAAFNQMQKEATLSAAEQAAIGKVLLLQEPVAAVMSVMRARPADGRFLIYDMGGGTLDIAIAESIGGRVALLAHGGIEMCGGRDIDRLLVQHIVKPWLLANFALSSDPLEDPKYRPLAHLAAWATERAKIELSGREEAIISLSEAELRVRDQKGHEIYLDIPVSRTSLDRHIWELVDRSVQAAQDALHRAGLTPGDVERLVFVGGPTQYKPLRDRVSAALDVLGSTEVNPMTAVAEGAALYAEAVDWAAESRGRKASRGALSTGAPIPASFAYTSRTAGTRAKCVAKLAATLGVGYEYQIDSLDSGWSSGRVQLREGAILDLPLTKQGLNTFKVFIFGPSGEPLPLEMDRLTITRTAATVDAIPASHSIGIEVLEKVGGRATLMDYLLRAGEALPKKGRRSLRAAESLKAGSSGSLKFKLWEGEIGDPVRDNRFIGMIKIQGSDLEDGVIPAGAELICDYEVADSGTVTAAITVPSIAATFRADRNFYSPQDAQLDFTQATRRITSEAEEVQSRVEQIAEKVQSEKLDRAASRLTSALTMAGSNDPETSKQAMDDVLEAKRLFAQARQEHLPEIRQIDLDNNVAFFNKVIRPLARLSEATSYDNLVLSAKRVIGREDGEFENYLSEMRSINAGVLWRQDWFLVDRFNELAASPHEFSDRLAFDQLVARGREAVRADDMQTLRGVLSDLFDARVTIGGDEGMFDLANIVRS
ncbi:MAG TPA: Hsp70 family protein [Gemmatimonadales bacterium]|jgi:molecular chaperone DnaK